MVAATFIPIVSEKIESNHRLISSTDLPTRSRFKVSILMMLRTHTYLSTSLNVPLSTLACNRLILSLRGVYFRHGDGARSEAPTLTTSYHANYRPPISTHGENEIHLNSMGSPNPRRDHLRSPYYRSDPLRTVDSDWERETYMTNHDIESVVDNGSAGHYPKGRSTAVAFASGSGLSPHLETPAAPRVTITRTTRAIADDGAPYELSPDGSAVGMGEAHSTGADWWDSSEATGSAVQSPAPSRVGVYETKVGYRHDRVPDDLENTSGSPRSPRSL